MKTFRIVLVLFASLSASFASGQSFSYSSIEDSVMVGDTALIGVAGLTLSWTVGTNGECRLLGAIPGGLDSTAPIRVGPYSYYLGPWGIFFYCTRVGRATLSWPWHFEYGGEPKCGAVLNTTRYLDVSAIGISNSMILIRPKLWTLTMAFDSATHTFISRSIPTFSNNISDTTLFSSFSVRPTLGLNLQMRVLDSGSIVTEYLAAPFRQKKPLELEISSANYRGFDSVVFSVRVEHNSVDSIIVLRLPVRWIPPSSISEAKSLGESYVLPNPFSSHATVGLLIYESDNVRLDISDVMGRIVQSTERECIVGINEFEIEGDDLPAGTYWYVARGSNWTKTGKLVKKIP